nr:hypothetical protein [uncultured Carboxylicivirga sp.]
MNKKRIYTSPKINSFEIDSEISLVMMTQSPGHPGGGGLPGMESASTNSAPNYQKSINNETPFGGTSPDYDNL